MTKDRLADAARVFLAARVREEAAKQALKEARARRVAAAEDLEKVRGPLAEAIVQAARDGVRQRDILARIDGTYSRERVRQICRAAGVEPAE